MYSDTEFCPVQKHKQLMQMMNTNLPGGNNDN